MRKLLALALAALPSGLWAQIPVEVLLQDSILPRVEASVPEGTRLEFTLPADAPQSATRVLAIEQDLGRAAFAAILETEGGQQHTVRGRVYAIVDTPVPTRTLMPGAVLRAEDFEIRPLAAQGLGAFTVTQLADLEQMEVRRTLPAGRPVQSQSLQAPRVVKRGDRLTLLYDTGALALTAPARALEDGALGDTLRVQNLHSNKTVTALALGEGRVEVRP